MSTLPDMPPNYHGWWKGQKTERKKIEDKKPCNHSNSDNTTAFVVSRYQAQCSKCHLGLEGEGFEILNGKLINQRMAQRQ